jgi:heme/copper-type cytochrome/quinol oxidase subunit 3
MEAHRQQEPYLEPEPAVWQPRNLWTAARMLAGSATFFFISFVFAYFYLRSLDMNRDWKIGHVSPPIGLGIAILVVLVVSAVALRVAARNPLESLPLAALSLVLALVAVGLQAYEWTTLGFGPSSGGYASVFVGWTITYSVFALFCAYWIETQVATIWRARREGWGALGAAVGEAGLESCSFFWAYYVFFGFAAFVILYLL